MPDGMNAGDVLDREYLEMRARIVELAACMDRMDRGEGDVDGDARLETLVHGIQILFEDNPGRAERVQLLFSRTYEENWQQQFGILLRR